MPGDLSHARATTEFLPTPSALRRLAPTLTLWITGFLEPCAAKSPSRPFSAPDGAMEAVSRQQHARAACIVRPGAARPTPTAIYGGKPRVRATTDACHALFIGEGVFSVCARGHRRAPADGTCDAC